MRKSIIGIIMAVTLVGSSLAFPVQAYAADVGVGQVVPINDDGIECNSGTVKNNFGGTVNGGTVTNQWYEYILTGGRYIDISKQTTGDNRTWIGQAQVEKGDLGKFYITVAANDGMTFDYATVDTGRVQGITNADGSISFGNINSVIRIVFKQFINNNNNNNAGEEATIESIIANEEAMPVTSFISNEAVAKIPEAAKNSGASYNLSVITSSQGFTAAINKISEAVKVQNAVNNAGGRIASATIYSEKPLLFTADVLNAISASDIDFVFVLMHNGKMYKVTIPRGAKIDFTNHACEGPLYFGKILGTTEEIG